MRVAPEGFILIFERLEDAWALISFSVILFPTASKRLGKRKRMRCELLIPRPFKEVIKSEKTMNSQDSEPSLLC